MAHGRFVTVINCMDGRVQEPVSAWMKERFRADHVDTITEPGPDGILSDGPEDLIESIKSRVLISVNGHGSRTVAVVSHHDCAGNPVEREKHLEQNRASRDIVSSWDLPIRILGLWVGSDWNVEVLSDSGSD